MREEVRISFVLGLLKQHISEVVSGENVDTDFPS